MRLTGPKLPPPRHPSIPVALEKVSERNLALTFVDPSEAETSVSFGEVFARARAVAGALASLGIVPGDRVAIVLPTGIDFVDAFFGAQLAGAVPVPLYPPVRLGRLDEYHRATARMLQVSGARVVLTDARLSVLLGVSVELARPELGVHRVSSLRDSGAKPLVRDVDPESLGLIQFSSGSTVDPKPVALTHRALVAQNAALAVVMPDEPPGSGVGVSWLPLYHDMGLIGGLLSAFYYPGPLVLIPPEAFLARPALWLRAISRHRGTHSPAPNFAYGLCLKRIPDSEVDDLDLSSWRFALNGAEPVSPELLRRFVERFGPRGFNPASLMPVYGLSEAALAVTFPPPRWPARTRSVDAEALARTQQVEDGGRELVSVGIPVPGFEVEVRDESGAALPQKRVGRVFVRGPSVMREYFEHAEATARALVDGWLDTGDLGFIEDGELYLCGRAKDLVILRGANHVPQEFEECLEGLDGVRTGCAVALGFVPEGAQQEELLILAEAVNESALQDAAAIAGRIRQAILERTAIRAHTVEVLAAGTLPRTSSGKLRRQEALRRYLARELAPPKPVNMLRLASEMAKGALAHAKVKLGGTP